MANRVALLFQDGNFVGREYFAKLAAAGRKPHLTVAIGQMKPESVAIEEARTGGRWNPPQFPANHPTLRFDSLKNPSMIEVLRRERIDICIQGGIGILKAEHLALPRLGWINVHPGRLPAYRGNSCPEWALYEDAPIVATAHIIDQGIDTGPVICERAMKVPLDWSYADLRARLYGHCADVLIEALARLDNATPETLDRFVKPQPAEGARYLPQIPPDKLATAKSKLRPEAVAA
ncbi:formyltransferase family protein [Desertibaculum subflavum]|uniref:formyltransferase family protein n=1 Tax=Desertibaculum subflavum TaxID=2268458 RepID=UPI000E66EBFF